MLLPGILIALVVVAGAFVALVASRPSEFRTSRSATTSAPPEEIFALVNDFHDWERWSPWAKIDPKCKMSYEGAAAGVGAVQRWDGNNKVGAGSSTITESRPNSLIRIKLEFQRPFKATNTAEFTFEPRGGQTHVTWSMFGKSNFMAKAFGLFVDCDKMVGKEFEKGLAQLKSIAESSRERVAVA